MLIWRGVGIIIPVLVPCFYWILKAVFPGRDEGSDAHLSLAFFAAGFFWWLTMKRRESGAKKIMASGDEKKIAMLKRAQESPAYQIEGAHFFFIPVIYWHYLFYAAGLVVFILSFKN